MRNIAAVIALAIHHAGKEFTGLTWDVDMEGEELEEYKTLVKASADRASDDANKAYMILMREDQSKLNEALDFLIEASREESRWGEDVSYGPPKRALYELIDLLDN